MDEVGIKQKYHWFPIALVMELFNGDYEKWNDTVDYVKTGQMNLV
jgi:hypothetical protein